jgi:hypothetical protein
MQDVLSGIVVAVAGSSLLLLLLTRFASEERLLLLAAYAAHIFAAFAQVLVQSNVYGSGDIFGYAGRGEELAAALRLDFQNISVEMFKLLLQQDAHLPIFIHGAGSTTGSMAAIAGFATYLTGGGVYAGCVLVSVFSFYGTICLYQVYRSSFPRHLHVQLLVANMLVPSVVYWSSGLLKESVAMAGLGPLALGVSRSFSGRWLPGLALAAAGALVVGLVKPYILFVFVVGSGIWFFADRAVRQGRPVLSIRSGILALVLAVGGIILLGKLFPRYAWESLAEQAAYRQDVGQRVRGDSTYVMGDGSQTSMTGQLIFAPFALVTALFRPFIFEGAKVQQIINSLETTAMLGFTIAVAWKCKLRTLWQIIVERPVILFSIIFTVTFGVAVGLSTTNLGTLSRYRMPLIPMFASTLVVLWAARQTFAVPRTKQQLSPLSFSGRLTRTVPPPR